jgi:hypothetical protein
LIRMKRPCAAVRCAAVDHGGMAEDHVSRLARQFDYPEVYASDDAFPVHEVGDPVGR